MSTEKSATEFLNVDLDLQSQSSLMPLIRFLGTAVVVLHQTEHAVSLELSADRTSPESAIAGLLDFIESLPPDARDILSRCESRVLNVGIQAGEHPHSAMFNISPDVTMRMANAQLGLTFTIYAPIVS